MSALPTDAAKRKAAPVVRGFLDYFPLAVMAVAELSHAATQQHHPDEPMHWDRDKSTDHADCLVRHVMDRGKIDTDGKRHTTKAAWRAFALLQEELEAERAEAVAGACKAAARAIEASRDTTSVSVAEECLAADKGEAFEDTPYEPDQPGLGIRPRRNGLRRPKWDDQDDNCKM